MLLEYRKIYLEPNMKTIRTSGLLAFVIVLLGLVGCYRQNLPSDLPKLFPCKVTVTQEGAPLAKAQIVLEPVDAASRWYPGGTTDESGATWVMTNGRYKGAPAGKYKVTVQKKEIEPSKLGPEPPLGTPENVKWVEAYGKEIRASFSLVENQYAKADSTPLEMEVSGKSTEAVFDVGKKIKTQIKRPVIKD